MREEQIIDKVLKGDTQHFSLLIELYQARIFSLMLRLSGNRENAEELTQDVFVKVYTNLSSFGGHSKFSTWLYRIAYNTAISGLRSTEKLKKEMAVEDWQKVEVGDLVSLLEPLKHEQQKFFLGKALACLNKNERFLMESFYLEEMKISEIMEITNDTQSNLKVKLHRIRKKMHKILTDMLDEEYKELY